MPGPIQAGGGGSGPQGHIRRVRGRDEKGSVSICLLCCIECLYVLDYMYTIMGVCTHAVRLSTTMRSL